ncbi:hypothetical protein GAYE_PCTG75G1592 [Galdieria yellowstonensis]|uniref:Uncharacterized protein n=1 Tax=Galdieria yellowstonensis TaxID=3028027 RepID=A0AAV9I8M5_9RHOD|nr:hypothetical protein GAYE_PCTG75G1592 [Galdieria yellowstonensis]
MNHRNDSLHIKSLPGELCLYDEQQHLAAFVAYPGNKAMVIFITGLTEGLFAPSYFGPLAKALYTRGFTTVQPILSSSYHGFGRSSLDQDVAELDTLIDFLSLQYEPDSFFLIGHSTGCQDAVTFFRKGRNAHRIRGIVLQAPVSDRDFLHSLPHAEERLKKAEEIYATQGPETLLNDPLFTSVFPVLTARRFLSLAQRLGDDDMFSYDLTDEELDARLRHMRNVPTYAIFSEKDEAVPDSIPYLDLAKRLCAVMGATCYMLSNANHAISNSEDCTREFIEQVVNFIEKVYSSTSE